MLETDLKSDLAEIFRKNRHTFQQRVLRTGAFQKASILIYGLRESRDTRPFMPSVDRIANFITMASSSLQHELAPVVRQIVALPRAIILDENILTHVWLPETGLLVFYMYPQRLHREVELRYPERFIMRRPIELLPSLFETILKINLYDSTETHKFLLPSTYLQPGEIAALGDLHEHFNGDA